MQVLHVVDRWNARGGGPTYVAAVLDGLCDQGVAQDLLAGAADPGAPEPAVVPLRLLAGLDAPRGVAPGLVEALAAFGADVVHVHNVVNPELLEALRALAPVVTVQDHRFFCPSRGKWTREGAPCRVALSPAACAPCFEDRAYFAEVREVTERRLHALRGLRVGVLSAYMKAELEAAGVAAAGVSVTPPWVHGLDPDAAASGAPCVLFAGRLVAAKGVDAAIAAWRRSGLREPLVFAGTGPLRTSLEQEGFEVTGWLPHAAMSGVYRRARALVMPSRWQEPFGIVGLEALSLGVPVAAWDAGGVREWHPGVGHGLVPWGDVDALAQVLVDLAGRRATEAPGFSRQAAMDALFDIYRAPALG